MTLFTLMLAVAAQGSTGTAAAADGADRSTVIPAELSFVACPNRHSVLEMLRAYIEGNGPERFFAGLEATGCVQLSDRETTVDAELARKTVRAADGKPTTYLAFEGITERGRTWGIVDTALLDRHAGDELVRFAADHAANGVLRLPSGIPAAWICRRRGDALRLLRSWRRAPDGDGVRGSGCAPTSERLVVRAILGHSDLQGDTDAALDGRWYVLQAVDELARTHEVLFWSSWERP